MRHLAGMVIALFLASPAWAESGPADLAFQPHPGAQLPLLARVVDEEGRATPMAHYFVGQRVIVVLQYLRCQDLCPLMLGNLFGALGKLPLEAGRDYRVLVISIDPRDTPADAAAARRKYLDGVKLPGADGGVFFLTGPQESVRQIAETIGFPYRWDRAAGEYAHPEGFVVAAPDGRVVRYLLGIAAAPPELHDGLAAAAHGETAGPLTRLFLLCHLGAPLGRYTVAIETAFILASLAAGVGAIAAFASVARRRRG